MGAERDPDADLARAAGHRKRGQAVDADDHQDKGKGTKGQKQTGRQPLRSECFVNGVAKRLSARERDARRDAIPKWPYEGNERCWIAVRSQDPVRDVRLRLTLESIQLGGRRF